MRLKSTLLPAEELCLQFKAFGLSFVQEFRFAAPRRWRADFALPAEKPRLLVEVEGGIWVQGRHSRGAGYISDCKKYNAAVLLGYRVIRVTGEMIRDGSALDTVEQLLTIVKEK